MRLPLHRMSSGVQTQWNKSGSTRPEPRFVSARERWKKLVTWVEGEVIDEALPGDEGDLLDRGR